ncbi:KTSC domain-containing protein, partial [Rhizobium ruizarguesonis]
MEELSVTSKIIKSVYFSQEDGRLRICFKNGEE